jgi:hypothetical protein
MKRILIPTHAKNNAKKALKIRKRLSKSKKFGLSRKKAKKLGVISGLNQAKYLINNKYLTMNKAMQYYRFYQRFKNCRTKKCENALNLWGGRKFLKTKVFKFIRRNGKKRKVS